MQCIQHIENRANRAEAAIGPIEQTSQSGKAQRTGNSRAEVPTGPIWQRQQSIQSDRGADRAKRTEAPIGQRGQ